MDKVVRVEPVALMPTQAGCAVFLGDGKKVIMFYVDPSIGDAINVALGHETAPRPLTHDLFSSYISAMGGRMMRALIVKFENEIYFARLFIETTNEMMERKIIELDARPSDCIAMAVRSGAPIYFLKEVWEQGKDMTELLEEMRDEHDME